MEIREYGHYYKHKKGTILNERITVLEILENDRVIACKGHKSKSDKIHQKFEMPI